MSSQGEADWFVYMVRCADQSLYTGVAIDVAARVLRHNEGTGARYTRSRRPVELVYSEQSADKSSALRREAEIKRLSAVEKRAMIRK